MKARILIAEDEAVIARDLERRLRDLGYDPLGIVPTGEAAVLSAKVLKPSLVLMDIRLAGRMDGIDAAVHIRDEANVPTVFLTAFGSDDVIERSKAARPLGYLIKPCDTPSLRSAIELALHQDASDRRLRMSEALYRAVIDGAQDAIVTTDGNGRILAWNRGATRTFGWTEAEAIGASIDRVLPESMQAERRVLCAGIVGTDAPPAPPSQLRCLARCADQREIPVEISSSVWRDESEIRMSWFVRDVTERHLLEARLQQARQCEIAGQVAGALAHDFHNLLTVIRMSCDLVARALSDDHDSQEDLRVIRESGIRGQNLVQRLLTFNRQAPLHMARHSLGLLVLQSALLIERLLGPGIALVIEPSPPGDDEVWVDAMRLEQALLNLATNARDAMPDGGTFTLAVNRRPQGLDGPAGVELSLTDTGVGMSPGVLERAFEPLFTTKTPGMGTGLGLASVQWIVAEVGGTITVRSAPGLGTTFAIRLPDPPATAGVSTQTQTQVEEAYGPRVDR